MKIGVNARLLLPGTMEGITRFAYESLRILVQDHPNIDFYFFFDRAYDPKYKFADNVIPIVVYPYTRHPVLIHLWLNYGLPKAIRKYNIDVLFSPEPFFPLSIQIPSVVVCHDIAYFHFPEHLRKPDLWYYRRYFPKYLKAATKIICVSEFTRKDIIKAYDLDEKKITVGYNDVKENLHPISEKSKFDFRQSLTENKPYFLYLGSIHPRKNIATLLLAFEQFCDDSNEEIILVLCGRFAWRSNKVKTQIEKHKYKRRIIHLEPRDEELNQIIGTAICMVYISHFEGFGLPIIEAMKCEVPVITANGNSMSEIAGDAAILVDQNNPIDVFQAMKSIYTDEKLRSDLIKKGKENIKRFSWNHTAQEIFNACQDVVSK